MKLDEFRLLVIANLGKILADLGYEELPSLAQDRRMLRDVVYQNDDLFIVISDDERNGAVMLCMGTGERAAEIPARLAWSWTLLPIGTQGMLPPNKPFKFKSKGEQLKDYGNMLRAHGMELENSVRRGGCNDTVWENTKLRYWD